eukprot:CAMPEP_0171094080 /NCGR_PEP_ID=MMETSP0766_2-20121228/39841_1 /TAXON_ID=439317 /ORGANISM="Gambierdiscus australes, Strain CAWD 149" /LENGTH=111 /DNA_ID=CAMNT_0011552635 /DNA_START=73 /DNA_END=408 /DNA_ORIENTATION=+
MAEALHRRTQIAGSDPEILGVFVSSSSSSSSSTSSRRMCFVEEPRCTSESPVTSASGLNLGAHPLGVPLDVRAVRTTPAASVVGSNPAAKRSINERIVTIGSQMEIGPPAG